MADTVILGGARTPIGKFGGGLKDVKAAELGGIAIRERWSVPVFRMKRWKK